MNPMQSHQVDVTVPTFFAQSGLSEYHSHSITPVGYSLQGDNCHVSSLYYFLFLPLPPTFDVDCDPSCSTWR